jgi:hypothetical protein
MTDIALGGQAHLHRSYLSAPCQKIPAAVATSVGLNSVTAQFQLGWIVWTQS